MNPYVRNLYIDLLTAGWLHINVVQRGNHINYYNIIYSARNKKNPATKIQANLCIGAEGLVEQHMPIHIVECLDSVGFVWEVYKNMLKNPVTDKQYEQAKSLLGFLLV